MFKQLQSLRRGPLLGTLMFTLLSFLFVNNVSAQYLGQYSFVQSAGTYAHLTGGTNSTATGDDGSQNAIPLGFNLTFESTVYTHVCINTNGWVKLGNASTTIGGGSFTNELNYSNTAHEPLLAALWDDNNRGTGSISYLMTGSAPNRVFEINYDTVNIGGGGSTSATQRASYLIRIYETTNAIEFIYGPTLATAGTLTASVGLTGLGTYASVTPAPAATVSSTSVNNAISSVTDLISQRYLFTPPPAPADPPTPTQAATAPDCINGSELLLAGTPGTNETWYWQTSATGTSTATPHVAPHYVPANGTYYVRTFNSVTGSWSNAASITVSNFALPADPAAPTANQNPACVTTGSILTAPIAPGGENYYWETSATGTSTTNNASSTLTAATSGTYYVRSQNTTTMCWSLGAGSLAVTIQTYIPPAATGNPVNNNICAGTLSQPLNVTLPATSGTVNATTGTIALAITDADATGVTSTLSISGVPAGATITNMSVTLNATHTWDSDLSFTLTGPNGTAIDLTSGNGGSGDNYTNTVLSNTASTAITSGTAPFTGTFLPEGNLTNSFSIPNGTWNLKIVDGAAGDAGTLTNWAISISYTLPVSTISWYDAATGGAMLGTGSPFESVGTSVLPNTMTGGIYNFYAESVSGACISSSRALITVSITEVLANLSPINATCNGGNNGSFTLGTVQCGTGPFLYSIDGGVTFGNLPTNLIAGTYNVIMQDQATMGESAPILLVITEPAAPTALNATNVTYYNATLGWTTTGNETSWGIIYGPAGFNPATGGTTVTGATNPYTLNGVLTDATSYDFYVYSECGPAADTSGPLNFVTDHGFLAWDNTCGPGFVDISTTGTPVPYTTFTPNFYDDQNAGITLPWPWSVNGTTVNTITVGVNGGLLFNTLTGFVGYTPAAAGMFPYNQDLESNGANPVFYQSFGTAPNRQFVIQWVNMEDYSGSFVPPTGNPGTFEILVDEATSEVYYLYGDVDFGNVSMDNGAQATIALYTAAGNATISSASNTYLTNNSCVHFYNALCPNISSVTGNIFPNEAILNWGAGLYGEGEWHVVYGLEGFDPSVPAEVIDSSTYNTPSADLYVLDQNTTYEAIIYSDCSADNIMSTGFHYIFTTPPFCSNPTNLAGTSDVDSLELTWNFAVTPGYPVTGFNLQYGMGSQTPIQVPANGINNADTIVNAAFIAGGVYQVYVQAECSATNDTSAWVGPITVVMPLSNDSVCGAETLALGTEYTFNNVGAGVSIDETNIAPPATGAQTTTGWANSTLNNTTWFKFVAPASGSVRINNTAINYNGQAAVYNVTDCGDFNSNFLLVAANDNEIGGTSLAPNFTVCGLTPGNTYYMMHDGSGTTGNYSIKVTPIVLQAGSADPLTKICTGSTLDLFTTINGNDVGGVWSAPVVAANASITGSTFNSNGLGYQTFNFQYRMSDGCAYDSIVSQVQVYGLSNAGTDGGVTVCKNEPVDLLSGLGGTVDVDGTWYDPSSTSITGSSIHASQFPGSFNYNYVTGNGVCPNDTSHVVITVLNSCDFLSVEEAVFEGVQLYPNPTTGIINIDADKAFVVNVTDANGKTVAADFNSTIGTTTIDLSKVQVGVYFVTLKNEVASKVFRVVVQ